MAPSEADLKNRSLLLFLKKVSEKFERCWRCLYSSAAHHVPLRVFAMKDDWDAAVPELLVRFSKTKLLRINLVTELFMTLTNWNIKLFKMCAIVFHKAMRTRISKNTRFDLIWFMTLRRRDCYVRRWGTCAVGLQMCVGLHNSALSHEYNSNKDIIHFSLMSGPFYPLEISHG